MEMPTDRIWKVALAGVAALVVGCPAGQMPATGPAGVGNPPAVDGAAIQAAARVSKTPCGAGDVDSAEPSAGAGSGSGTLSFAVRWPARSIQAIPDDTEAILVTVKSAGSELGRVVLVRPEVGQPLESSGSIDVDAGSEFTVMARAYASPTFQPDDAILSLGASSGVQVVDGVDTPVRLSLEPVPAPELLYASPAAAGPMVMVELAGNDLGMATGLPFKLYLVSQGATTDLTPSTTLAASGSVEALTFMVPEGARSGNLVVEVNKAFGSKAFQVVKTLTVSPANPTISRTSGGTIAFTASGTDTEDAAIATVPGFWFMAEDAILDPGPPPVEVASITDAGTLTPLNVGTASVIFMSGIASGSTIVTVTE